MKSVSRGLTSVALLFFVSTPLFSSAEDKPTSPAQPASKSTSNVDNSKMNLRDRSNTTETPQDQSNNAEDRKFLAMLRRNIVHDKSLSTSAHNIKIMSSGGVVILRGPVKSNEEKMTIEKMVHDTPGVKSIDNQLDVKTN
ncbi:BON domain-containing protein [Undibacterium sp. RuTC16W]|uniref:BON domain-containing protein n=1 Tax=Undibacterium sp. RuTC16W TaxID=3413048 RepID=UPI003BF0CD5C